VSSVGSVPRSYLEDHRRYKLWRVTRVEAGSNTSTATLRVVGGDEKEVSNLRQQNMVTSPKGLGPKKDYAGSSMYKRPTRLLVREGAP
jgi:hypothetical protein